MLKFAQRCAMLAAAGVMAIAAGCNSTLPPSLVLAPDDTTVLHLDRPTSGLLQVHNEGNVPVRVEMVYDQAESDIIVNLAAHGAYRATVNDIREIIFHNAAGEPTHVKWRIQGAGQVVLQQETFNESRRYANIEPKY